MGVETIPQNRPLSLAEAAIVRWMLQNASRAGDLSNLEPSVADLRVVGRCSCGCPSVDFMPGGQALGASLIAEAQGVTADGNAVGVLLWARNDELSALEFYDVDEPARALPLVESLIIWPPAS